MKNNNKQNNKNCFKYKIQVRYPDFDTQCFVNHCKISSYIEGAYLAFFIEHIKTGWTFNHVPILLKSETTKFCKPITYTSKPICCVHVKEVRSKGVHLEIKIFDNTNQNIIYVIANRIIIHVDIKKGKPIKFSKKILFLLKNIIC